MPHPEPRSGRGSGARLWLVRHAEVHEDWQGRAYGDLDVPLSSAGLERSEAAAADLAALRPTAIVSSPLQRALTLARALGEQAGVPVGVQDALGEIHRGRWQGESVGALHRDHAADVQAFYADPWEWRGHGGESDADVAHRAWPVVDTLLAEHPAGRLVLVSHYNVIRILVAGALGIPPARSFALRIDPGRMALLEDAEDGWRLLHSNVHTPAATEGVR